MRELDKKLRQAHRRLAIKPGDIFESCSYAPVLCLGVDYKNDQIWGISLVDGTYPQSCSLLHCGVRKLTPKQAWEIRTEGPLDLEVRAQTDKAKRWWHGSAGVSDFKVGLVGPRRLPAFARTKETEHGG